MQKCQKNGDERPQVLKRSAAERINSEMPEERDEKTACRKTACRKTKYKRERVTSETAEERERRLVSVRTNLAERTEK